MKTVLKSRKNFSKNERNYVDLISDENLNVGDSINLLDSNGDSVYDITISGIKEKKREDTVVSRQLGPSSTSIFIGEPVLDIMIDKNTGEIEYVPGGQALSQAIAYKNANPGANVVFLGNFGSTSDFHLDQNGQAISDYLKSIGITPECIKEPGKKTRYNYVVVDSDGRSILNPGQPKEQSLITDRISSKVVGYLLNKYPHIDNIGIDGALPGLISKVVESYPEAQVEIDAGRITPEEIDVVNGLYEKMDKRNGNGRRPLIIASRGYSNELLNRVPTAGPLAVVEEKSGKLSREQMINDVKMTALISSYMYPNAIYGTTVGNCGCVFVDEKGTIHYLESYKPDNISPDAQFKDNSAGDTFHALVLSGLNHGLKLPYAFQYATVGTSIAGFGEESTAKVNTPSHGEIMDVLTKKNKFHAHEADGLVVWTKGDSQEVDIETMMVPGKAKGLGRED